MSPVVSLGRACEKIPSLENQNYQEAKQAAIAVGVNPDKIEIIILKDMPLALTWECHLNQGEKSRTSFL